MIGLIILVIVVTYVLISKKIVLEVYKRTQSKVKKRIAIAIMVLIPFGDVIIGFPMYAYFCIFESGTKIYKTVDGAEGYYSRLGSRKGGYDKSSHPLFPSEGYDFIEYKEKKSRKYYRNYWIDTNSSIPCFPSADYNFGKKNKCIARVEVHEKDLSRWEISFSKISVVIPLVNIKWSQGLIIRDRKNQSMLSYTPTHNWSGGWINLLLSSIGTGSSHKMSCRFGNISRQAYIQQTLLNVEK